MNEAMKDVTWIGDSREQVRRFPKAVRRTVGEALRFAQRGAKHPKAKPMRGIGSGVWEIVARHDTDTYRAVYTVNIGEKIYGLHAFQKKSTCGIRTPKREIIVNYRNKWTFASSSDLRKVSQVPLTRGI